jgi:hypothetical protein
MRHTATILTFISAILLAGCLIKPPEVEPEPWTKVENFLSNTNIRILHTKGDELYVLADAEFARINKNNDLIEKRPLELPIRFYGRPAVSDDVFFQMIRNDSDSLQANFYLVQDQNEIYTIQLNDLVESGEFGFRGENEARNGGTFSDDGSLFIVPVIQIPNEYYTFLLFDLTLSPDKKDFLSIDLKHRIDLEAFPADQNNLQNVKYIKGFFYATSRDGAVRINPQTGNAIKISEEWVFDVFLYDGKVYMTFGSGDQLAVSEDNGLTFESVEIGNEVINLFAIEVVNDQILTQQTIFSPFRMVDPTFNQTKLLDINEDFGDQLFGAFQDITFFNDKYYLPVFKELYTAQELLPAE